MSTFIFSGSRKPSAVRNVTGPKPYRYRTADMSKRRVIKDYGSIKPTDTLMKVYGHRSDVLKAAAIVKRFFRNAKLKRVFDRKVAQRKGYPLKMKYPRKSGDSMVQAKRQLLAKHVYKNKYKY